MADTPLYLLPELATDVADTEEIPVDDGTNTGTRTVLQLRGMSNVQRAALVAYADMLLATPTNAALLVEQNFVQTGLSFLLPPSGNMGLNGACTWATPASDTRLADAYVYFPAAAGLPQGAGCYYCTFSTTQAAQVYNIKYTDGQPNIPTAAQLAAAPVIGAGVGAWAQTVATDIVMMQATIPGNTLGRNGMVESRARMVAINSVGSKVLGLFANNDECSSASLTTGVQAAVMNFLRNAGKTNVQRTNNAQTGDVSGGGGANFTHTLDTTQTVVMKRTLKIPTVTDWAYIDGCDIGVRPKG